MIIGCPKCETRFVVAPQAIGKDGRMVRCSRCSKTWFQEAPEEDLEIVPEKVIKAQEKGAKPASAGGEKIKSNVPAVVKQKSFSGSKRWGMAAVILVGVVASLYYFRPQLEDRFEATKVYYQKWDDFVANQTNEEQATEEAEQVAEPVLTPPHPSTFLTMTNSLSTSSINGVPTLSIDGEIRNSSDSLISLPTINVDIKNAAGNIVFNTIYTMEPAEVAANDVLQFTIAVPNYPPDSSLVDLSLMWDDAP